MLKTNALLWLAGLAVVSAGDASIAEEKTAPSRDLAVRGRTVRLEIIKMYSVRDGGLHDIYYRCETRNITAHTPGAGWCCRKDFELREVTRGKP